MHVSRSQLGYTITEMIITVTVFSMMIVTVFVIYSENFSVLHDTSTSLNLEMQGRQATRQLEEDIQSAAFSLSATNNTTHPDTNSPGGSGWNIATDNSVLILETLALDSSGNIILDLGGDPYKDNFVYYVDGKNLYRRVVANSAAILAGSATTTSCPPASASSTCPGDKLLVDRLENVSISHYDSTNSIVADPAYAHSTEIILDTQKTSLIGSVERQFRVYATQRNVQ